MIKQKNNNLFKKIVVASFFCAVITLLLFVTVLQIFFPQQVIDFVGFQFYFVSNTGSMEPTLNFNDLILVKRFDFDLLQKGDLITFVAQTLDGSKIVITHEINDIFVDPLDGTKYIETKGVNLPLADTIPVSKDGIYNTNVYLGKYVGKSEFLGNFLAFAMSPLGILSLAVNLACLMVIFRVLNSTHESSKLAS